MPSSFTYKNIDPILKLITLGCFLLTFVLSYFYYFLSLVKGFSWFILRGSIVTIRALTVGEIISEVTWFLRLNLETSEFCEIVSYLEEVELGWT